MMPLSLIVAGVVLLLFGAIMAFVIIYGDDFGFGDDDRDD